MPGTYYVSEERLAELKKELEELKTKKRMEIAERLKNAKEYGDLSENSEYTEARDEQARVETRIFELEEMLKSAAIIKKTEGGVEVQVGSMVVVSVGGAEKTFHIVGSSEAKPEEGKISNESPIGAALLGKHVGDTVPITSPAGTKEYKIVKVG